MLIECPECHKKNMALSEDGITSHVYKSKVHSDLTKKEKNALYRQMIQPVDVSALGKKEDIHLEKDLSKLTGIK